MAEIPEGLARSLENRYRLEREIGRGGMATVYLARDVKHNRQVAIKVLKPHLAETIGTERFLREIQIAAQLNHPHILPLLDSEEAAGHLLYIMPFVDGESLRTLLSRERQLPLDRAISITTEVAGALSYAHRRGVVHRDIKPENILFSEGHAIVADFGIAKAISSLGARELTRTGFPIGTPGYMSPEQAAGLMDLDARSDVYSLACLCYEMLIGDVPAFWLSDQSVSDGRMLNAPGGHRKSLDALPARIEPALVAALTMRPQDRVSTPAELVDLLAGRFDSGGGRVGRAPADNGPRLVEARSKHGGTGELSTDVLREIGAEVGLATRDVRAAIEHRDPREPARQGLNVRLAGAPTVISLERTIEGKLPETEYPQLVEEMRLTLGNVGNVSTLAGSLAWNYAGSGTEGRDLHISIMSRGNSTRIRIDERLGTHAGGIFGGVVGGFGVGGGTVATALISKLAGLVAVGMASGTLILASAYFLARVFYTQTHQSRYDVLVGLIDRLADHVAATAVNAREPERGQLRMSPS